MQFNRYIALPKSSLFYHRLFIVFRLAVLLAVAYYLWQSFLVNGNIIANLGTVNINWSASNYALLITAILLLPINWLLEAKKWQIIAGDARITLFEALKGVIIGLTLDNFLPVGTGAISGRVLSLTDKDRLKLIPGILAGQILQTFITLLFGLFGFWMVWKKAAELYHWQFIHSLYTIGIALVIVLAVLFWRGKIKKFIIPLKNYSLKDLKVVFVYSLLRYIVFLTQFLLLAYIITPESGLNIIIGCATWVFAARTFMPKISNIERLGIRALAVVFFMELYSLPSAGMLISVIVLWFINLAIPSIAGLMFFKNLKAGTLLK
ncbi:MAG: hypothetical protein DRI71_10220 [Bacteroidetes bacterium]|nr:MAG: hypothetical protein DRI71_10220 [Bacteroidota bacterium]